MQFYFEIPFIKPQNILFQIFISLPLQSLFEV